MKKRVVATQNIKIRCYGLHAQHLVLEADTTLMNSLLEKKGWPWLLLSISWDVEVSD